LDCSKHAAAEFSTTWRRDAGKGHKLAPGGLQSFHHHRAQAILVEPVAEAAAA